MTEGKVVVVACDGCQVWMETLRQEKRLCQRCLPAYRLGQRDEAWRALLERDIAEVAWEARWLLARARFLAGMATTLEEEGRTDHAAGRRRECDKVSARLADCEAWLARARAALGGGA